MKTTRLLLLVGLAVLLAIILRLFLMETIRVGSPAMESSLQEGDRVFVEKWSLGAKIPQRIRNPFSKAGKPDFLTVQNKISSLPGLAQVHRNDVLIYRQPAQKVPTPIDELPLLIGRCLGLPGERLQMQDQDIWINKKLIETLPDIQRCYVYTDSTSGNLQPFIQSEFPNKTFYPGQQDQHFVFLSHFESLFLLQKHPILEKKLQLFMGDQQKNFDVYIPYKGFTIDLNRHNVEQWKALVYAYENVQLTENPHGQYTFKHNYYWILNDHRGFTNDSRSLGLLPDTHLLGKAKMILYSPKLKRMLIPIR